MGIVYRLSIRKKGLNDYLFDEQREKEKVLDVKSNYQEAGTSDEEENEANEENNDMIDDNEKHSSTGGTEHHKPAVPKRFNKYDLITNSNNVELYAIDKESYLKSMLTFTSDKSLANKYLEQLVDNKKTDKSINNKVLLNKVNDNN
jgi:hypothetical protein